ncbi:hypothetical protein HU200_064721 [Digitaria exilis]|uniref:RING-type E3 ubiquitin transferase n=1 Tax=Digitaria exilis TaxID=1010633 RepID=A0A835DVA9_9POAL|nr:hypothetical protein HU200_064721 [Digitaria exilis]
MKLGTMDDAASPRPSGHNISTETTRLDMWPVRGEQSSLVLHLAVTETHKWLGIGGRSARLRRPRRLGRTARTQLSAGLQTAGDELRPLMVRATTQELRMDEVFRGLPSVDLEDAVPRGVEAHVAELAAAALPARREASFSVHVEFVYDEAEELLRACVAVGAGIGESTGGDAPPSCAICFEEMAAPGAEETTWLPGCAHGFHGGCIGRWFDKASTCPVCRRDKLRYLPPAYRAVRDRILSDPEGEC